MNSLLIFCDVLKHFRLLYVGGFMLGQTLEMILNYALIKKHELKKHVAC